MIRCPIIIITILVLYLTSTNVNAAVFLGATVIDKQAPSEAAPMGVSGIVPTVTDVPQDSPAQLAGLKQGDIILSVDKTAVERSENLPNLAARAQTFIVMRNLNGVVLTLPKSIQPNVSTINSSPIPQTTDTADRPILRIETGMHTAQITQIGVDKSGRWLVSASHDKTVRVWDLADVEAQRSMPLQPSRILRPPIGDGNEGTLNSVAISPDGNLVATGGWTVGAKNVGDAIDLYLFSRHEGRLLRRTSGLPDMITYLTFSPDGSYLAATMGSGGMRLFAVDATSSETGATGRPLLRLIAQDSDYGSDSYRVHFSPDGLRLVTSCWDGYLRVYSIGNDELRMVNGEIKILTPIAKNKAVGGEQPYSVKFSPDGAKIAVGFEDSTKVNVLSARDLSLLYAPYTDGVTNGNMGRVAWSTDGAALYAGGSADTNIKFPIRCWANAGRGEYKDLVSGSFNTIMDLAAMPDGGVAFGAGDPFIGVLSGDFVGARQGSSASPKNGKKNGKGEADKSFASPLQIAPALADYRNNWDGFKLSQDGTTIGFGYKPFGKEPASFSITDRNLTSLYPPLIGGRLTPEKQTSSTDKGRTGERLASPDITSLQINGWKNTRNPTLNNNPLKLEQYEASSSLAIAPDKESFLLGTVWLVRRFDKNGTEQWNIPVPSATWAVNIAKNGRVAVAAFGDGTIRWYRYSDGKELVAFFPHADKKRWVLWTPEGFFDHSPGGEELIGFHLNRGKDKEAEFIPVSRLYKDFYRPDLVTASFEGKDISEYAKAVDINKLLNVKSLPPKVRILSKAQSTDKPETELTAEICDNGGGVGDVTLYLNDMPIAVESGGRGLKVVGKNQGAECFNFSRTLTLDNGSNVISIMAYNRANNIESERANVTINHTSRFTGKPNLHILTIAVDKYRDGDLQLKYSRTDANGVAELLQGKGAGLFGSITRHTLTDSEVTKEKLETTFADIGKKIRREDMFILFVAGHGITYSKDGSFYFLPVNFRYSQDEDIPKTGVSMNDFKRYLANIQASKSLLLLDTCNSGSFAEAIASRGILEKTAINKLTRAVGRHTMVASSKSQVALEGYEGHGAFSWTLLDGMKGKAANQKGQITVNSLVSFVETALPELTYKKWGYEQIPQKSLVGEDFQIGVR